tara:strand:+ start:48 stop:311 length:264 start_codon:yes stop_codon:yes gene_type:complete
MSDDIFDFGFTAVNEDELEAVQQASIKVEEALSTNERLDKLFNAIQPLITNLKANPEKDYIYWPNRLNKVEQFETMLQKIYTGSPSV